MTLIFRIIHKKLHSSLISFQNIYQGCSDPISWKPHDCVEFDSSPLACHISFRLFGDLKELTACRFVLNGGEELPDVSITHENRNE